MTKKIGIALAAALLAAALIVALLLLDGGSYTVGICYRENEKSSNAAYRAALEQALDKQGMELIITDADEDQAKQLAMITQLADKKCDILIVEPVMTDAVEELKSTISNTGLPVVLCNRELDMTLWEDCPNVYYVGTDFQQGVTLQGQMVLQLPEKGDINGDGVVSYIMICGPEDHSYSQIHLQMTASALSGGDIQAQQIAVVWGDWTQDSGRKLCKEQLAAFGKDIEVILCGNDQMAMGAVQAVADGGRTVGKDVYLLGMGAESDMQELIAQGAVTGTVVRDTGLEVANIAIIAQEALEGNPVEKRMMIPYIPLRTENATE